MLRPHNQTMQEPTKAALRVLSPAPDGRRWVLSLKDRCMRLLHLAFIAVVVAGCASKPYRETQEGKFSGALDVRWVHNDYFLFLPDK